MKNIALAVSIFLIPIASSANVINQQLQPSTLKAGSSQVLKLTAKNELDKTVDLTPQYSFSYLDSDPAVTEVKIYSFNGKPVIYSQVAGSKYRIEAKHKTTQETIVFEVDVIPSSLSRIIKVSGDYQTGRAGSELSPLVVQAQDAYKNPIEGVSVFWNSANESTTNTDGKSSYVHTLGQSSGMESIVATAGSLKATFSAKVKQQASGVARIVFTKVPTSVDIGSQMSQVQVSLYDESGSLVSANSSVTVSAFKSSSCYIPVSDPTRLSGEKMVTATAGVATFSSLAYSTPEVVYLKAVESSGKSACSRAIAVKNPSSATKLKFSFTPSSGKSGSSLFPPVKVSVLDQNGNLMMDSGKNIQLSAFTNSTCTEASSQLDGTVSSLSISGVTMLSKVKPTSSGSLYIKATSDGLESDCSPKIEVAENDDNVVSKLLIRNLGSAQYQDQSFSFNVDLLNSKLVKTISAQDSVTISAHSNSSCSSPAAGEIKGETSVNAVLGTASVKNITFSGTGGIFLKAATSSKSVCSSLINFAQKSPGVPAKLAIVQNPSSTATRGELLSQQPKFQVVDVNGESVLKSATVVLESFTDSNCSVKHNEKRLVYSNSKGLATFSDLQFESTGTFYLKAIAGNIVSSCSSSVTVNSGSPTCLASQHLNTQTNSCDDNTISCSVEELSAMNSSSGTKTWNGAEYGSCNMTACMEGYIPVVNSCVEFASKKITSLIQSDPLFSFYEVVNGKVIFQAIGDGTGREIFASNGTQSGTMLLKDIRPGPGQSGITPGGVINDLFIFTASDGVHGVELWKTDGSPTGTQLIKDLIPGSGGASNITFLNRRNARARPINGKILALVSTYDDVGSITGRELWGTNGSAVGTERIANIPNSESVSSAFTIGNKVYFFNARSTSGRDLELWSSDGTTIGTEKVMDMPENTKISDISGITVHNDKAYFSCSDTYLSNRELWISDGTAAGTKMIKDMFPGNNASTSNPNETIPQILGAVGDKLIFSGIGPGIGRELLVSDGTETGTFFIDINPGINSSLTTNYGTAVANGKLYFIADGGAPNNSQLWETDGTVVGTKELGLLNPNQSSNSLLFSPLFQGKLLMLVYNNQTSRRDLMMTDGTLAGSKVITIPSRTIWEIGILKELSNSRAIVKVRTLEDGYGIYLMDSDHKLTLIPGPPSSVELSFFGETAEYLFFTGFLQSGIADRELFSLPIP